MLVRPRRTSLRGRTDDEGADIRVRRGSNPSHGGLVHAGKGAGPGCDGAMPGARSRKRPAAAGSVRRDGAVPPVFTWAARLSGVREQQRWVLRRGAEIGATSSRATTTPAVEDGKGVASGAGVRVTVELRRDRACTWFTGGRPGVSCTFSRAWFLTAIGEALPLALLSRRTRRSRCAWRAPAGGRACRSGRTKFGRHAGDLARVLDAASILGPAALQQVASSPVHGRAAVCVAGSGPHVKRRPPGRPEDRSTAKTQLRGSRPGHATRGR